MSARDESGSVQVNFRVPRDVLRELDVWVEEINAGRRVKKVSKNSVLLSLLAWGLLHRPGWAGSDPPAPAQPPPRPYPLPAPPQMLQVTEPVESPSGPVDGERFVVREDAPPKAPGKPERRRTR